MPQVLQTCQAQHRVVPSSDAEHPLWVSSQCPHVRWGATVLWVPPRCLFPNTALLILASAGGCSDGSLQIPREPSQRERETQFSASPSR